MKLGMKKCSKSISSQREQFESWMNPIEAISDLIIEARDEIDNDRLAIFSRAKIRAQQIISLPFCIYICVFLYIQFFFFWGDIHYFAC